uniref:Uncharacterized protein n=1 Tax=Biomphalaria glabrata TaxID=6526 RepID=A0A2C9M5T9_BIOGL
MNSTYCSAAFSWKQDKSLSKIISCSFDPPNHEFHEYSRLLSLEAVLDDQITLSQSDEVNSENCVLNLVCSKPCLSKINGICIVSESRTLEISNYTGGYLCTIRGSELSNNADSSRCENQKLYLSRCSFEDSYKDLSIKFLSLGGRTSFTLQSIIVFLTESNDDASFSKGTFDIHKLQKEIELMGDTVSHKARDFLKTMQQFEQNRIKTQGQIEKLQSQPFSLLSQHLSSESLSGMANGILGFDAALQQDNSFFNGSLGPDFYALLQVACGSVSKKREEGVVKKLSCQTPDSGTGGIFSPTCSSKDGEDYSLFLSKDHLQLLGIVDEKVNKVKMEFHDALLKTKEEFNQNLETTKNELNQKLDLILKLLNSSNDLNGEKG